MLSLWFNLNMKTMIQQALRILQYETNDSFKISKCLIDSVSASSFSWSLKKRREKQINHMFCIHSKFFTEAEQYIQQQSRGRFYNFNKYSKITVFCEL